MDTYLDKNPKDWQEIVRDPFQHRLDYHKFSPLEKYLPLKANNLFRVLCMLGFQNVKLLGFPPKGSPKDKGGNWHTLQPTIKAPELNLEG